MKFVYELGSEMTAQEQQARAIFYIGRAEVSPVVNVKYDSPGTPINISIDIVFNVQYEPSWLTKFWNRIKRLFGG